MELPVSVRCAFRDADGAACDAHIVEHLFLPHAFLPSETPRAPSGSHADNLMVILAREDARRAEMERRAREMEHFRPRLRCALTEADRAMERSRTMRKRFDAWERHFAALHLAAHHSLGGLPNAHVPR